MPRKRLAMEMISHEPTRTATFKKRKVSVIKKARELSILCDVPVYVAVSDGSGNAEPEIWPEQEKASEILSRFNALSQPEQTKKMVNREGFVSQQIGKMQVQLEKIERENRELEMSIMLQNLLAGRCSIEDLGDFETVTSLLKMADTRIAELKKREESHLFCSTAPLLSSTDAVCGTSSVESIVPELGFLNELVPEQVEMFDVSSLSEWGIVEKDILESLDPSNNADVSSLPNSCMVEKEEASKYLNLNEIGESSSGAVSFSDWSDELVDGDIMTLFDEFSDCLSYEEFDPEMASIFAFF